MIPLLLAAFLQSGSPIVVRTIDRGTQSGIVTAREVTVRSEEEWAKLWSEHAASRARPSVDFSRDMVVGVFLGTRPTAGFGVQIAAVQEDADGLVVQYRETRPGRDAITAQVITSPFQLAAVPQRAGAVRFERVE
jgi:hypothetical protein